MNCILLFCALVFLLEAKVSHSASVTKSGPVIAPAPVQNLEPKEIACINENNFEATKLKEINSQDIVPENDTKFNNYLGCYWQKKGWLNPNGKVEYHVLKASQADLLKNRFANEKRVISSYLPQIIWSAVVECEHKPQPKTPTIGEKAVKVQNCIMSEVQQESKSYLNLRFPIPNH